MSFKRFLAPGVISLLVLLALWISGIDTVFIHKDNDRINFEKYVEVQKRILDNYVDPVNITQLYKDSIRNLVANLKDSTLNVAGTPIDTSFKGLQVNNLRESIMSFEKAYVYVSNKFPKANMDKMTEAAIRGMFYHLDPHSIYIDPLENKRISEEFKGKFFGIGVQFDIINDTITVISPLSGGPSEKLGIQAGDRIVTIDGKSAIGFTTDQVVNTLRGPKNSIVEVGIKRPHEPNLLHFKIKRDDIPLTTIDTDYMLDSRTGYIKINRFARTTHHEFMQAVDSLKKKGMKRLILDLRNNPGGFLDQAIMVANEFFPKGVKILSTKSRFPRFDNVFYTQYSGSLIDIPLMVMINEGSASASEIVTGSIQDHDRGLVVGRRSFGKGLVQQQYGLIDTSAIRVTISRYYTPSGREIQKPYKNGREQYALDLYRRSENAKTDAEEFIDHVPDSLKFKTDAGRTVYGGGGIVPDHIIQNDTTSSYVFGFMRRKNLGIQFVLNYYRIHKNQLKNEYLGHFDTFRKDFKWSPDQIKDLRTELLHKGMIESDTVKTPSFRHDTLYVKQGTFHKEAWIVEGFMKADLARQIWGPTYFYPIYNDVFDSTLKKAMTLWPEVQKLKKFAEAHDKMNREYDY